MGKNISFLPQKPSKRSDFPSFLALFFTEKAVFVSLYHTDETAIPPPSFAQ